MTGKVWFTADLHVGHRFVAGLRGHSDTNDHDSLLASHWDRMVQPDDQVWVLGDISVGGSRAQRAALEWIADRPGTKHLVSGNHDDCAPMHRNAHKWLRSYLEAFESVAPAARRRYGGQEFLLSHYPYKGDHTEVQRYDQWRLPDHGLPILHGHTHSGGRVSHSAKGTLQLHVGVDAWGMRPVSIHQVHQLMTEKLKENDK
jgi:calcineurin-like phosphoesterase family protein